MTSLNNHSQACSNSQTLTGQSARAGDPTSNATAQQQPVSPDCSGEGPLSIKEVCRITGLSRTLISAQIRLGKLNAKKAGRRTLVMRTDLRRWLEGLPAVQPNARKGDV